MRQKAGRFKTRTNMRDNRPKVSISWFPQQIPLRIGPPLCNVLKKSSCPFSAAYESDIRSRLSLESSIEAPLSRSTLEMASRLFPGGHKGGVRPYLSLKST